jgi:hypothetical protein
LYSETYKATAEAAAQIDVLKFRYTVFIPIGSSISEMLLKSFAISLELPIGLLVICRLFNNIGNNSAQWWDNVVNNESERTWNDNVVAYFKTPSRQLPRGIKKKHERRR